MEEARLSWDGAKAWGQYYLRLLGTCMVNGSFLWLKVVVGSLPIAAVAEVDVSKIGWTEAWGTLAGAILGLFLSEVTKNLLPLPKPPGG